MLRFHEDAACLRLRLGGRFLGDARSIGLAVDGGAGDEDQVRGGEDLEEVAGSLQKDGPVGVRATAAGGGAQDNGGGWRNPGGEVPDRGRIREIAGQGILVAGLIGRLK